MAVKRKFRVYLEEACLHERLRAALAYQRQQSEIARIGAGIRTVLPKNKPGAVWLTA
jgi:hypothetical protein